MTWWTSDCCYVNYSMKASTTCQCPSFHLLQLPSTFVDLNSRRFDSKTRWTFFLWLHLHVEKIQWLDDLASPPSLLRKFNDSTILLLRFSTRCSPAVAQRPLVDPASPTWWGFSGSAIAQAELMYETWSVALMGFQIQELYYRLLSVDLSRANNLMLKLCVAVPCTFVALPQSLPRPLRCLMRKWTRKQENIS